MPAIPASSRSRTASEGGSKRSGSRYILGDLLGRGGMAEVFAGYSVGDHGFQKPVAIKRLLPELANDEVFVDRLIEEAKLLVGMQHGQIVSVLDLAREGDDVFLVMEFVDGPSLRQLIKARGARGIPLGVATYVVQAAAAGLEFAHSRAGGAIIHADISPSNLLLTTSGEVRVADFGIARREGLGQGVVEGKWAYMAPEQARGEALTPRSDVFALGVVLYELITGQHPFGRAVSANQRDDQMRVAPPRKLKPNLPADLDAICMRALAHDPRDRYARMQSLIDALVEARYANGFREGAAELAYAIREAAPKAEASVIQAAPRTMHTERPITLMTRSLLRDDNLTSAGRPRARRDSEPIRPLGPSDPPPRDAFPMLPTMEPALRVSSKKLGSQPRIDARGAQPREAHGSQPRIDARRQRDSLPSFSEVASDYVPTPSSGAQTMAREVDQVALAEAAARAAAALMQLQLPAQLPLATPVPMPSPLRIDNPALPFGRAASPGEAALVAGTPIPPFRMSSFALQHDELASVVGGGNTVTGGGAAGIVAVEPTRIPRWGLALLAIGALAGASIAVGTQLAPAGAQLEAPKAEKPAKPEPAKPEPAKPEPQAKAAPQAADAPPASNDPFATPDPEANAPKAEPEIIEVPPMERTAANTGVAPAEQAANAAPAATEPTLPKAEPELIVVPETAPTPNVATPARVAPAAQPAVEARSRRARSSRDGGRVARSASKSEQGILSVQSSPWSWVTVDGVTKETPDKFYLAPGTYRVAFRDASKALIKTARVTIEAGKMTRLDEQLD